ncbi:restriction endonuclease subunit S [Enterobacter roggenkampii]|uniref:restriction endonuclease subunit S n=1 Tax=Enterobacter roggenkampii TaxID=1812935 RepID=UPI003890EB26
MSVQKGIMQQIFSQKFRFKEGGGKDFPEWGEVTLENIGSFFSGGTPASTNRNYYNGVIPFIRSAEINSDSTELFISEEGLNSSSAKLVNKGDILYALYGATSGEVGISKIHGAINQAILCIRSTLNTSFLYYFLKSSKEQIVSTYIQGGQGNLSAEIIRKLKVPTPSTGEQIKIANFLSALDDKITAKKAELDKLKIWKQGLLQQMFV